MPECQTPLWPCAMTGAASCLAGFDDISVVIHGSSGCYYYPATLLHAQLHGTFILENEVVFGSGDRLREVIENLLGKGRKVAVISTCVPAAIGEDIRSLISSDEILVVDSPGFIGGIEVGYRKGIDALAPTVDPNRLGVNIDGISLSDPFYEGNIREVSRILHQAGIPIGTVFCRGHITDTEHAAPLTIGTNDDFASGVGECIGGTLGIPNLQESCKNLSKFYENANFEPVFAEIEREEERLIYTCDKFLRKFDPPRVAIFAGASYARFASETLKRYIDAQILIVGARNDLVVDLKTSYHMEKINGINEVQDAISKVNPDLIIGSSFERSIIKNTAFVGIIPPLRGKVRLTHPPLVGISGTLFFTEEVLNACMDKKK